MLFIQVVFIATFFVSWVMVAKLSGFPPATTAPIVMGITAITPFFVSLILGDSLKNGVYTPKGFMVLVMAGVMNGLAIYLYSYLVSRSENSGLLVSSVSACMIVVGPLLGYLWYQETLTLKQTSGIMIALLGLYLTST